MSYEVLTRPDGTLSARVTIEPDRAYSRDGFETYAEVSCWVEGLRVLMAACGAPLIQIGEAGDDMLSGTEFQPNERAGLEFIPENGGGAGIRFRERKALQAS